MHVFNGIESTNKTLFTIRSMTKKDKEIDLKPTYRKIHKIPFGDKVRDTKGVLTLQDDQAEQINVFNLANNLFRKRDNTAA